MSNSSTLARAAWGIVALLLVIAATNLYATRQVEPQLGLWDADLATRFTMPAPIALDPQRSRELYRDKPLLLIPSSADAPADKPCRDLFRYYGLDASRLERAGRAGNPQGPCVAGQPIYIPLDGDR